MSQSLAHSRAGITPHESHYVLCPRRAICVAREKLESILSTVYQKSLTRRQNSPFGSRDSISYALLDATKQSAFLNAFDKAGFKSVDKLLVAYIPWKRKFASFVGEMTTEEVKRFIGSVLNGDIQFKETRKKPVL
nr:dnaj protein erdj3a [Quercus suber]